MSLGAIYPQSQVEADKNTFITLVSAASVVAWISFPPSTLIAKIKKKTIKKRTKKIKKKTLNKF